MRALCMCCANLRLGLVHIGKFELALELLDTGFTLHQSIFGSEPFRLTVCPKINLFTEDRYVQSLEFLSFCFCLVHTRRKN